MKQHEQRASGIRLDRKALKGAIVLACVVAAAPVWADDDSKFSISGFVREEIAVKANSDGNPFNQAGNPWNGVAVPNTVFLNTQTRPAKLSSSPTFNVFNTRAELDVNYVPNDVVSAYTKLRIYGDFTHSVDNAYDGVNVFQVPFYGTRATPLEVNGKYWMADLPAAYLDIHKGPWWLRVGNQQIAWGESLFFRVLDLPNGLDLRRHTFLNVASEEYSDQRVPSLALRGSYEFPNGWGIDSYVERFQPTVYSNPDTPYNVIPSAFTIDQGPGFDEAKNKLSAGLRFTSKFDALTVSLVAVNRVNPDGVFAWTQAKGPNAVCVTGLGCTPFEVSQTGVFSSSEWFETAGRARLDGVGGLASVYNDFPAAAALRTAFGLPYPVNQATARTNLDAFFGTFPLRGWLSREYMREHVYGAAANYIISSTPGSLLDQLVVRGEVSVTPNKKYTNPNLSKDYLTASETAASIVFEKYYRMSQAFPATFMVFEWLYKSQSDLFGRSLSGFGANNGVLTYSVKDYNAVAFAMQQPLPNLIWRADLAILYDLQGGVLVQPGVRYKPSVHWQVDLYANYLQGGNSTSTGTFAKYSDEVFARFTAYF
jgi:hypothetical protein